MATKQLQKSTPKLIEDFKGHWRKALQNQIDSVDGVYYRVRSCRSEHLYSVHIINRTCTCVWGQYPIPDNPGQAALMQSQP